MTIQQYVTQQKETLDMLTTIVSSLLSTEKDDLTREEANAIIDAQLIRFTIAHERYKHACEDSFHESVG